jgi:hypothetical protein
MGNVTNIFGTASLPTDYAKKSFAGMLTRLAPGGGNAKLFAMSEMSGSDTDVIGTEHGWWTKTYAFLTMTLGAAVADGAATTFTVASTTDVIPGSIYRVASTTEHIRVLTVASSTSITVARGQGSVAAAAIANSVKLYKIGSSYEEASTRPLGNTITPVLIKNYTQIFRNSWVVSGTNASVSTVVGDGNVAESKQDAINYHASDIEQSLIFGQKNSTTVNGQPLRYMDGVLAMLSNYSYYPSTYAAANVTVLGSTTTYDQLEAAVDPVFNQVVMGTNGNQKAAFCGAQAIKVVNAIGRKYGTYQLLAGATEYGLQFLTVKFSRGEIKLIEHPMFTANPDWTKMMLIVDVGNFSTGYLKDRKTQYKEFNSKGDVAQDNGIDAVGGTFTSELTCTLKNPPANAVITNFTAAA